MYHTLSVSIRGIFMGKQKDLEFIKMVVEDFNFNERTSRESAEIWGIAHSSVLRYLNVVMPNAKSREILDRNKARSLFGSGVK